MKYTSDFLEVFLYGIWLTLPLLLSFALAVVLLGLLAGRLEKWSVSDACYWSFITAFTVGYGDFRPSRKATKLVSIIVALQGIMFTGIIVALTVSAATRAFEQNVDVESLKSQQEPVSQSH